MQQTNDPQKGWPEGWLFAAAAGVVAAVLSRFMGDVGLLATLFIGAFVFLVFGVLMGMFWGNPLPPAGHGDHGHHDHGHSHDQGHSHGHTGAAPATEPMPAQEVASVEDATAKTGDGMQVSLVAPVAMPVVAPAPMQDVTSIEDVFVSQPVAKASVGDAAPEVAATPHAAPLMATTSLDILNTAATEPAEVYAYAGHAVQPQALPGPRDGSADRLQAIEGIGPAMETLCHDLGIWHFDQIAGWGAAEILWMDSNLKGFKGRVTRDRWVAQAKLIGEVGIAEFARRAKINDY